MLLAPVLLWRAIIAWYRSGQVFEKQFFWGAGRSQIELRRFAAITPGRSLARLFDIAAGRLAWVGAAPVAIAHSGDMPTAIPLRPGCLSIYRLQRLTGSQYDASATVADYPNHSLKESITIILRFCIARTLAAEFGAKRPARFRMLGVDIDNCSIDDAMSRIKQSVTSNTPSNFAFVNPDCLNIATVNSDYARTLSTMDGVFADGIGVRIGCRILGIHLRDNVNGTDLFPLICAYAEANQRSLYLLGGKPGVADTVMHKMQARFTDLRIVGTQHGYFDAAQEAEIVEQINRSDADILLVAFGAPRQEFWIEKHSDALKPAVRLGVGGLFDFYSERISRSPRWMRDIGLEWVWRLLQEPGRMWRRYVLGNPLFLFRVHAQARKDPGRKVLQRFSKSEFGFLKALIRFKCRHFAWTLAVFTGKSAKRLLDIAVSGMALFMLIPFLLLFAAAIRIESPGPVFFAQTRVGRWGQYFTMYKFRSMCTDAEVQKKVLMEDNEMDGGVLFKMKEDPRITNVGRFIRKYSIDELPQFWNVLIGDMSLVGPRPPVPSEVDQYSIHDRRRLEVKPGITCIWQVSGRSEIAFVDQVELDVDYIESHGVLQDIKILLKTIPAVLLGKGAY